jgi:SAM-dependent methyltransferase
VLDPGCGTGVWGRALRDVYPDANLSVTGVDLVNRLPTSEMHIYQNFITYDFMLWAKQQQPNSYDYIIGNPPFEKANEFVWSALRLLKPGAHLLYLLPSEFSGSKKRANYMFQYYCYRHEFKLTSRLDFTGGTGDMRWHSIFWWDKGWPSQLDSWDRTIATHSWHDWKVEPVNQLPLF